MKRILITGVEGFIGQNLANKLKKKFEVIGLDLKADKKDYEIIVHNLASAKSIEINKKIDVIVHLAALTNPAFCEQNKNIAQRINVKGTKKLLNFAKQRGVRKFVFASSGGVYGFKNRMLSEKSKTKPFNVYTRTKCEAEKLAKQYSKYFQVIILRYFFPYGPFSNKDQLINRLINNIKQGKAVTLNKNGAPKINPIHINDLVKATILACKTNRKFEIINIAGKEILSIKEIAQIIGEQLRKNPKFSLTNKKIENMMGDTRKAQRVLGFTPRIRFRKGIKRILLKEDKEILLSVVIPVYNEEKSLESAVKEIYEFLNQKYKDRFEILLCENGSTDKSLQIAKQLESKYKEIKVLIYPKPNYGKAMKMGLLHSKGKYLANFSVDWYSFGFLIKSLGLIKDYDIIAGSKLIGRGDQRGIIRKVITKGYMLLTKRTLGIKTSDTHGLKILKRDKIIPLVKKTLSDGAIFDTELILRAEKEKLEILELPLKIREKRKTKLKMPIEIIRTFFKVIELKKMQGKNGF